MNAIRKAVASVGVLVFTAATACSSDRGSNRPPCRDRSGTAVISVHTTICPTITAFLVAPSAPAPNMVVHLRAMAVDPDTNNPTFLWSATAGAIVEPTSANTTYVCAGPGGATVTLKVSDGTCDDTAEADVVCPQE